MTDREEFEAWARPLHYILDPDAFSGDCSFYHSPETRTAWAIWQAARAQPKPVSLSDEQAHNNAVAPHAKRLAMELECLLLDCEDMAVVSKWFDSGMEAIQNYQDAVRAIEAASKEQA